MTALPEGPFDLIYADPPWRYRHCKTNSRRIENQYPTMTLTDIKDLPIDQIAADNSILFLWTTAPKVAEAVEVIAAWGFDYKTQAVWDKEIIGMGYYFRGQHEILMVATKGSPGAPPVAARVSSVIQERRGRHSKKPEQVYDLLEAMYPSFRKLELFARNTRSGWASWGNEVAA